MPRMAKLADGSIPAELQEKRAHLFSKIQELIRHIKELKQLEEEEYELCEKFRLSSIQSDADTESSQYVECPMPGLGTISTYSGPMASVWCTMPKSVAEAFVNC